MAGRMALSESDQHRVADLYRSGSTYAEIQSELGCSEYVVRTTLRRYGVQRRPATQDRAALRGDRLSAAVAAYVGGKSCRAVAREFGVGIEAARAAMQRAGVARNERRPRAWSQDEIDYILQ